MPASFAHTAGMAPACCGVPTVTSTTALGVTMFRTAVEAQFGPTKTCMTASGEPAGDTAVAVSRTASQVSPTMGIGSATCRPRLPRILWCRLLVRAARQPQWRREMARLLQLSILTKTRGRMPLPRLFLRALGCRGRHRCAWLCLRRQQSKSRKRRTPRRTPLPPLALCKPSLGGSSASRSTCQGQSLQSSSRMPRAQTGLTRLRLSRSPPSGLSQFSTLARLSPAMAPPYQTVPLWCPRRRRRAWY
mmetsp:Transcript_16190/g.41058  ORF Transcript_16190/g.41058 Transcript_16190/m.41058 type:complete len:247 (-) Transcript_16190:123-863(-)